MIINACSSPDTGSQTQQNSLTKEESDSGWKLLFDGKTTDMWRGYNQSTMPLLGWVIKDDALVIEKTPQPKPEGFGGDIITKEQYGNFELALEFMVTDTANSGIFYFVIEKPEDPIYFNAPEYQILDNATYAKATSGGDLSKHKTGDNYDMQSAPADYMKPVGEWNQAKIIHKDGHVEHWLNGNKCIEYQVGSPEWEELVLNSKFKDWKGYGRSTVGHIGLQDHQHEVRFRNIKIRTT
jgi:hypothetical protein